LRFLLEKGAGRVNARETTEFCIYGSASARA
jgi:hypothetical protein